MLRSADRGTTVSGGSSRRKRESHDWEQLVILEGFAHAQFIFQTDQGERLRREILRFLSAP